MVIQRIQSVYLLIAAIIMAVLTFVLKISNGDGLSLDIAANPSILILNVLIMALLLISIFLYKTLPLQIKVIKITVVLTIVSAVMSYYLFGYMFGGGWAMVCVQAILYVATVVFSLLAHKGCTHDYNLLRSSDRLR